MKRSRFIVGLVGGALVSAALVSPAQATEHAQRINELMLQKDGVGSTQFVELKDSGEPFPNEPYKLQAYSAAGSPGLAVTLNGGNGGSALNDWTVMTPDAESLFGVTGNQQFGISLDLVNGQVCFESSIGPITCLNWGTITNEISGSGLFPKTHVPTPGDGQSVRFCNGAYAVAAPTPKAANGCSSSGGGGGSTPGGGGTPGTGSTPPVASAAPDLHLAGAGSSKVKSSLSVTVECHVACVASASGTLSVPNTSKSFKIKSGSVQIAEGKSATLKVKLSKKARKAAKAALKARKKVKAKLTITAKNSAGSDSAKKTIKLRR